MLFLSLAAIALIIAFAVEQSGRGKPADYVIRLNKARKFERSVPAAFFRRKKLEANTKEAEAQTQYATALQATDDVEASARLAPMRHDMEHQTLENTLESERRLAPLRIEQQEQLLQHDTKLHTFAADEKLSVASYEEVTVFQKKEDIRINNRKKEIDQDVEKGRMLDKQRLDAYEREVGIDLNAALAQRLMGPEIVLGIKNRLRSLLVEYDEIDKLAVSAETKARLLAQQNEVIGAFQEDLREQMARHLLKAGNGENAQPAYATDDSPSGH